MKPAAFPCLLSLVGAAVAGAALAQPRGAGPAELRKQLYSADYRVYEAGLKGFVRLGTNAVPSLVAILREHAAKELMPRSARLAVRGLARLGPRAKGAVPELMRELSKGSDAYFRLVSKALGQIGPHAPKLRSSVKREILRRGHGRLAWEEVCTAASRLELDPEAGPAVLRAALNSTDVAKKVLVCEILAHQGRSGEWAREDLWAELRHGRHGQTVEVWLEEKGFTARFASSTLDDEYVNCQLAHALVRVSRNRDVPLQAFLQLLAHPSPDYRREAAIGLGARGVGARAAVLDLVRTANESRDQVAWEAITALGLIGPQARGAVPHLEYLARSHNRGRAVRAEVALTQIRGN